jgi:hypothetical protein
LDKSTFQKVCSNYPILSTQWEEDERIRVNLITYKGGHRCCKNMDRLVLFERRKK